MIEVTDATITKYISSGDGYTIIDFWAPWCQPCKQLEPILAEAEKGQPNIWWLKINADQNPRTAMEFGVQGLPCVLLLKAGQPVTAYMGRANQCAFNNWLRESLA